MFISINYDFKTNKIYHKYIENGKKKLEIVTPELDYYVRTKESNMEDVFGKPVIKKIAKDRDNLKSIENSNVGVYENDINLELKFLNRKYYKDILRLDLNDFKICKIDIEIESPDEFPEPTQAKHPINLITISYDNKYFTFGNKEYTGNKVKNFAYIENEERMLEKFIWFFRKQKFDIICGWNSKLFDVPYLINRCKKLDINYNKLSPFNIVREKSSNKEYTIVGVSHLDYMKLYKKFNYEPRESFSLNAISLEEIKEGKLDFEGTINNGWEVNWNRFVEYNIQDVILIDKLDKKLRFIELALSICYDSLIPFESVFSTLPMHTGYILKYLHRKNKVMPIKGEDDDNILPGGYVFATKGLHKYIISFDVESEYPHMILRYNIGLETLKKDPEDVEGLIRTPLSKYKTWETASGKIKIGGIYYDNSRKSVLAEITQKLFNERKIFKLKEKICSLRVESLSEKEISKKINKSQDELDILLNEIEAEDGNKDYYHTRQWTRKIQLNSLYGAVANKHFHFFNIYNAITITLGGQTLIKFLADNINDYLKNYYLKNKKLKNDIIVLIDTDSIYMQLDELIDKLNLEFNDYKDFLKWANEFCSKILNPFFKKILNIDAKKYDVDSIINFKREKIASEMIVVAKKRYVINVIDNEGKEYKEPKLNSKGIEIVRTDTPLFCRNKIKDTIKEIFRVKDNDKTEEYMKNIRKEFEIADIEKIAFPSGISDYKKYAKPTKKYFKDGLTYQKGTPIHNRAAINYNYMVEKYGLKKQKITNGTKMRYIYVNPNNELHTNIIGFVGNYPKEFKEKFKIDYDLQWEKSFQNVIQRLFDSIGWEEVNIKNNNLKKFFIGE